jgi:hypothetical protein
MKRILRRGPHPLKMDSSKIDFEFPIICENSELDIAS